MAELSQVVFSDPGCCLPSRLRDAVSAPPVRACEPQAPPARIDDGSSVGLRVSGLQNTLTFVELPGGGFLMGTEDEDGFVEDREGPVRRTGVDPFSIATTPVTNRDFAQFVEATGYRTDAELAGWSFVFHLLVGASGRSHVMNGHVPGAPWWLPVEGTAWSRPQGPGSSIAGREDHPVVHVSFNDAQEFCAWGGYRLPREAEWEYAARGGLEQARYPWGDDLMLDSQHRCNIWQGEFPGVNTLDDGYLGTCPADAFPANGYGLFNVAGNVWELCDDAWVRQNGEAATHEVVLKGGSYLCHDSYCNRYRVAARTRTTPNSSSGNVGFRVVG